MAETEEEAADAEEGAAQPAGPSVHLELAAAGAVEAASRLVVAEPRFAGPATLNAMVAWLAEASGSARLWWEPRWLAPSHRGAFYLVAMAAANMARTVLEQHAGNLSSAVNSQINTAVTSEIFSKAMRQKGHGRLASTGKVMNLVGNDAGQLSEWIGTIYKLPASLLSIVLGGWQLLGLLGPAPLLGGVGVLGIFAPLSYLATRHCNFWRDK